LGGLLYRDFLIIKKKYVNRIVIIFLILGALVSIILGFYVSSLLGLMLPLISGGRVANIFAEDDKDNWNKMVKTFPVSTRNRWGTLCDC